MPFSSSSMASASHKHAGPRPLQPRRNDKPQSRNPDAHDCLDVVKDLHHLLTQITTEKLGVHALNEVDIYSRKLHGCALARLYAQEYPGSVAGMALLNPIVANSDCVSIFPDPDAAEFNQALIPETITP
ncbi:uncharacterized protein BDW70DRAFT_160769 [Aspergillus foveolatus]|uniref:uncharacterized protein n=1 Tax=Aspergillus foveolatus TaxID=210207 RepID=UPI003CCE3570